MAPPFVQPCPIGNAQKRLSQEQDRWFGSGSASGVPCQHRPVTRRSSASIGHPSSTARLRSITWLDFSDQLVAAHGNDDDQRPPGRNKACLSLGRFPVLETVLLPRSSHGLKVFGRWPSKRKPHGLLLPAAMIIFDRLSRMETHPSFAGSSMKLESLNKRAAPNLSGRQVSGRCLCGAVKLEIDFPAFWAWHDHSAASSRARCRVCDLCRLLAQARPRGEGPKEHCSLRGRDYGVDSKLLLAVRYSAALRAQALAAHGQYPAGTFHRPYRPRAPLSCGHRGASGLGIHGQPACPR